MSHQITAVPLTPERLAEIAAALLAEVYWLTAELASLHNALDGARLSVFEEEQENARLHALVTAMHAAAVGETRPPLLGLVEDVAGTRDAFLAQQHRADTLDRIARQLHARTAELEAAQAPAELTVYRASHESIVFGLYTTPNAAWRHCEAYAEREFPAPFAAYWHEDEDGVTELVISRHGNPDVATGYVVTPLTVAAEYDPDGDE